MIISELWLREWIDLDVDTEGLVEILNMGGLEVDSVRPAGPDLTKVVVGRIAEVEQHPGADRLRVCRVDAGGGGEFTVVCGAPNARAGLLAPLAMPGAELPNGVRVQRASIRGVESAGMLCSARELDLGDAADGLLELDDEASPGRPLREALSLDDTVIEIELTANRGDCLSIRGVARELAVLTGAPLTGPALPEVEAHGEARIDISIDSPERCPRYVGRVVDGLDVGARTPAWLTERLRRCGVRPISLVVDVTNYVMLEIGQPMHAFDRDRLRERIVVRQAKSGETIELLDGSTHALQGDTLVIADAAGAVAIAGVMGGEHSAISEATRSIVLEAAFFAPQKIAGHARRYGLHTDASHRFERGVDPALPRVAAHYATALLRDIAGGVPGPLCEAADESHLPVRRPVTVRHERVNRLIGEQIGAAEIDAVLRRVGSRVAPAEAEWQVEPPTHRFDIAIECDLIEEIARVRGYDRLPASVPDMAITRVEKPEHHVAPGRIKSMLVDRDYRETVTYSFVDPKIQHRLVGGEQGIALKNPLAPNLSVMRTSLWPGLVQVLIDNVNRQHRRVRLFETGKTFHGSADGIVERERVGGLVTGPAWPEQWGQDERASDFFDVKSDIEALLRLTRDPGRFTFERVDDHPGLHPGQSAAVLRGSTHIGFAGRLHPEHQRALELPQPVFLFEIELAALSRQALPRYAGISRFPAIRRDLAVWVDEGVTAREMLDSIANTAGESLVSLELFDVYRREDIDSKRKSMAFGLTLQASSRTLTDRDVDSIIERTLRDLRARYGAELRT